MASFARKALNLNSMALYSILKRARFVTRAWNVQIEIPLTHVTLRRLVSRGLSSSSSFGPSLRVIGLEPATPPVNRHLVGLRGVV